MQPPLPATLALLHGDPAAFSWTRWEIHVSVLIGCALLAGIYLLAIGPLRRRFGWAERTDGWQTAAFLGAVAILFAALNGPLHDLSDYFLFSAHMVQHMLLMMIMPPLLLLGLPAWLLRPLLLRRGVEPMARVLTHPATAFAVYNVVLIGWHFPALYNWALVNHDVHIVQHLMFIAAALLMWWPVVDPLPELRRIGPLLKILYLFAFGLPMSIVSAFITMSPRAVYPWYVEAPRIVALTPLEDQQLGGLLMWIPGMLIYWTVVTIIFLRYSAREERQEPGAGTTRLGEWIAAR
ncbi:MAG: cytochrome c oxidase assembly protein [Longimicrobiales bacterium]